VYSFEDEWVQTFEEPHDTCPECGDLWPYNGEGPEPPRGLTRVQAATERVEWYGS
jgi:hypothetical protein